MEIEKTHNFDVSLRNTYNFGNSCKLFRVNNSVETKTKTKIKKEEEKEIMNKWINQFMKVYQYYQITGKYHIKITMHGCWYDYLIWKNKDKVKLPNMDTDSFIVHKKTEDIYIDIAKDAVGWYDCTHA